VTAAELDDAGRPRLDLDPDQPATPAGAIRARTLVQVHQHLRAELDELRQAITSVVEGRSDPAAARSLINRMTMRQNFWSLGAFCAAYCRVLTIHHTIEDEHLFSTLRDRDQRLAPVLDRLSREHEVIAAVLDQVDAALAGLVAGDHSLTDSLTDSPKDRLDRVSAQIERLSDALLSHLDYEEDQLLGPIGRLSIMV
jgi:hemerythrin-like domain-containing protein